MKNALPFPFSRSPCLSLFSFLMFFLFFFSFFLHCEASFWLEEPGITISSPPFMSLFHVPPLLSPVIPSGSYFFFCGYYQVPSRRRKLTFLVCHSFIFPPFGHFSSARMMFRSLRPSPALFFPQIILIRIACSLRPFLIRVLRSDLSLMIYQDPIRQSVSRSYFLVGAFSFWAILDDKPDFFYLTNTLYSPFGAPFCCGFWSNSPFPAWKFYVFSADGGHGPRHFFPPPTHSLQPSPHLPTFFFIPMYRLLFPFF